MTADVTTLATWGDSESTSSSDESDDENTPNDEGEIDEDDDGMSAMFVTVTDSDNYICTYVRV